MHPPKIIKTEVSRVLKRYGTEVSRVLKRYGTEVSRVLKRYGTMRISPLYALKVYVSFRSQWTKVYIPLDVSGLIFNKSLRSL